MLSHKQIERQLVPILRPYLTLNDAELLTYRLIRANQNNAIPDVGGYSTIKVSASDTIGHGETGSVIYNESDEIVGQQFRQNVKLQVEIQTFDDEAILRANKLRTELSGSPLLQALIEEGFSFVDTGSVLDLTAIRDTAFEERTLLEIEFNIFEGDLTATEDVAEEDLGKAGTPHFYKIDAIDSVVVEGQVLNAEGEGPIIEIPINNPPFP
jgi:hypothetical protein